jgi:hypothetical protein
LTGATPRRRFSGIGHVNPFFDPHQEVPLEIK